MVCTLRSALVPFSQLKPQSSTTGCFFRSISAHWGVYERHGDQDGITINLKGFFPDGSKIRSFSGPPNGTKGFRFVAEAAGDYRLELTAATGGFPEGRYTITLEPAQPMAERLWIPVSESPYSSPRIRALENQVESADKEAVRRFWHQVRQEGTPLAEETRRRKPWDGPELYYWRADPHIARVASSGFGNRGGSLKDFAGTLLGGVDSLPVV